MSTFVTQPFNPQTYNQVLQALVSYMSAQSSVTDANIGAVNRTFFESIALVIDNAYFQMVNVLNAFYINTATGVDLDRRGTDFNLPRFLNSSSVVTLFFSGTIGTLVPAGTICYSAASGNTPQLNFITQNDGTVGPTGITAICTTTGAIGNVSPNTIVNIQNNPNFSLITSVTNPSAAVGGFDQESDASYRTRIIAYLTSLSQGTVNAITSALLNIPTAGITEVKILQINLSPSNPGGPSTGYALSFTPPYTNENSDLQGTIYSALSTVVDLATVAALPTNTYSNGAAGVGATLTATSNGLLFVDGVAVVNGNRVLIKDEVATENNGVYVVIQAGDGSDPYVLIRATDLNVNTQFTNYRTTISSGGTLSGQTFIQTLTIATIGTDPVSFSEVNSCDVATTIPLFPANTYTHLGGPDGVGDYLLASSNGFLIVDGVSMVVGKRILVKDEVAPAYNGVYSVTIAGDSSTAYKLTRVTDLDETTEFPNYTAFVLGGLVQSGSTYIQTNLSVTAVGTDPINFSEVTGLVIPPPIPNSPGSIVIIIDNGDGSLPFQSVTSALNVANGVPTNYATYPGVVSAGIQAFVTRPSLRQQPIVLTIITDPNSVLTSAQIAENVKTAINAYFVQLPIGGTIYRSEIIDVVMNVSGVINVPEAAFTDPASDTTVNSYVRSIPGLLTINY
jgi:uncharacterized phage protein gp47/JayE